MKRSTIVLFLIAAVMFSCKSSKDTVNSDTESVIEEMAGEETIGIENNTDMDEITDVSAEGNEGRTGNSNGKNATQNPRDLVGSWEWIKTNCCGRMNQDTYPEEGEPKRIISFSNDGMATYFAKGSIDKMSERSFKISSLGPNQSTVQIGELTPAIFYIKNDTLMLNWQYMDLQIEYYTRVK